MKTKRKFLLPIIALVTVLGLSVAMLAVALVDRDTPAPFRMLDTSVGWTEDASGLRFTAEFDKELYDEVTSDENKSFGMLITQKRYLDGIADGQDIVEYLEGQKTALGKNTTYVLITENSDNPLTPYDMGNGTYRIGGVLTDIQYKNSNVVWLGIGFVTDGTTYTYAQYSTDRAVSLTRAASRALIGNTDAEQVAELSNYVYRSAAQLTGVSEDDYTAANDKSVYLNDFTAKATADGIDGDKAFLLLGEKLENVTAQVSDSQGRVLDIEPTVEHTGEGATFADNTLTAVKRGYTAVNVSAPLVQSQSLVCYTGSTEMFDSVTTDLWRDQQNGSHTATGGTIDGNPYFGSFTAANTYVTMTPRTTSVYFLDYLHDVGYGYIRQYYYIEDTTGNTPSATVRFWTHKNLAGSEKTKEFSVPTGQWVGFDVPIELYRYMSGCGAKNATLADKEARIDEHGFATSNNSGWYNCFLMFPTNASVKVYYGKHVAVKESKVLGIKDDTSVVPTFGQVLDLTQKYAVQDAGLTAAYTFDGKAATSGTPVFKKHIVTSAVTAFTLNINSYTVGAGNFVPTVDDTGKTDTFDISLADGLNVQAVNLIAMTDGQGVDINDYTDTARLTEAGFTVNQSYVKRYSDGTAVASDTLAADSISGIYTVSVEAVKGDTTVSYSTVLDLYRTSEGVEYESFNHADSAYAVTVQAYTGELKSSEIVRNSRLDGSTVQGIRFENGILTFTLSETTLPDYVNNLYNMCLYVTPRHTVEYYKAFLAAGTHDKLYAENLYSDKIVGGGNMSYLWLYDIDATSIHVAQGQAWGSLDFERVEAIENGPEIGTNVDLQTVIDNYDAFRAGTVMMVAWRGRTNKPDTFTIGGFSFKAIVV